MSTKEKKNPINKKLFTIAAGIGALTGVVSLAYVIVLHLIGQNPFGRYQFLMVAVQCVLFGIGFAAYRDKFNGHILSFRDAMFLGFGISSISSLVYTITIFLFLSYTTAGENSLNTYKKELFEMNDRGRVERAEYITEEIYQGIKKNITATTPADMALKEFRFSLSAGALLTIIMMIVFKHNPK